VSSFFDLDGKVALIIGGTSGIGKAVARRLVSAGCLVIVAGRKNRLAVADKNIEFAYCDVTDETSVVELFALIAGQVGKLDVLIITAGTGSDDDGPFGTMKLENFDRVIATNMRGTFLCLNEAPKVMADASSIIITSTEASKIVFPGYATYGASKSALLILAKHAAAQLGERGIRVNCLNPGTIMTPIQPDNDPEAVICRAQTCLGRMGTTDDVVGAYHFLAADESRYVTGTELVVDGGWVGGMTRRSAEAVMKDQTDS
jgi:NAD(P)-dependent dehydrogenase (short-subunit alcohol dehydrogenase family)